MNKIRGQIVLDPIDRLMAMSMPEPSTGCWVWLGSTRGPTPERQYGRLTVGSRSDNSRRVVSAHRYSYEVFNDATVPSDMEVCHRCDNPICINPKHLWVGTKQDNMNDREAKGRNKLALGESNGQAKLTVAAVEEIRSSGLSNKELARQFGVHPKTIQKARNGKHWLPAAPTAEGGRDVE